MRSHRYNNSLVNQRSIIYASLGLVGLTFISASLLTSSIVIATSDSVVDEINITVPISCTLTGAGITSHNAEIANGVYQADIGTTTLKAYCNDNNGFAIYAAGYTGNEIGGTNSNKLVGTSASNNATIETGLATSAGNPDVSNWAMKLDTVTSPAPTYPITIDGGFNSYSAVPSSYTKVAHRDSATDIGPNGVGSTLTTTYAAYISKNQPADTYSGKVIYTLVHPASETLLQPQTTETGKICYYANANDAVGTMGCQTIPTSGGSADTVSRTAATLLASNFSRDGYGFAGWSNKFDYATNPNQEDIKFYGPNETISFTAGQYSGTNNGLSLYAVWIKSAGSLQDSSKITELCGNTAQSIAGSLTTAPTDGTANLGSVSALTDQRDDQTYAIAKLADGKCWMIENLRLESTAEHNSDGTLAQGYGTSSTYGNFGGLADAESANFENSTTANSLYYSGTQSGDATINIGTSNYPGYRMPRYNNLNTPEDASNRPQNPTSNIFSSDNTTVGMYSYGNYYTWHAAIADTTPYYSGDHGTTSICPSGWRLPQGFTTSAGFGKLDVEIGGTGEDQHTAEASNRWRKYPNNFLYSGDLSISTGYDKGTGGMYWSSTADYADRSWYLGLNFSAVYPGTNSNNNGRGLSIRCTVGP